VWKKDLVLQKAGGEKGHEESFFENAELSSLRERRRGERDGKKKGGASNRDVPSQKTLPTLHLIKR